MPTPNTIRNLVETGANVIVNSGTPDNLIELVRTARQSGARVTVNIGGPSELLQKLADAGGNQVTFDFRG